MAGERILSFIDQAVRRERHDFLRYHLLWVFAFTSLALFPLLFLARFLEFTPPPWAFFPLFLPGVLYLLSRARGRLPGVAETAWKADRYYSLGEQLITAREALALPQPGQLALRLVDLTEERLAGYESLPWPRRWLRWPLALLLSVLALSVLLIWLPPYRLLRAEQLTPQLVELAQQYARIPGHDPITYMELIQAKRALEKGDLGEARNLLEQAAGRLEGEQQRDREGQSALAASPDLSFLAKGMEGDRAALSQLEQLSTQEQLRMAQEIQQMLANLPEGALRTALQDLATSLRQNDTSLLKRTQALEELLPQEQALLSSLGQTLSQLGGKSGGEGDQSAQLPGDHQAGAEGQVQPASGSGTQGGLSQGEMESVPASQRYQKAPPQMAAAGDQGLLYVPQNSLPGADKLPGASMPLPPGGTPLVLPQQGEPSYQTGQPGGETENAQPFQNYRDAMPRYQQQAVEQLTRQALPPELESLVRSYYLFLEDAP
ncbi:MAG: hypothetical protein NTV33_11120 [Coprothermobacterota bacterium]|nr:hypothetical protein [Coprothermobacterota bacterium]